MKIVIIAGGVPTTTFIDALINSMAEEGMEMIVVGRKTGHANYHKDVQTVIIPDTWVGRLLFILRFFPYGLKHIGAIYRDSRSFLFFIHHFVYCLAILKSKPDRVHIQWASFLSFQGILFKLFPGKILVSLRGAHINYTPILKPEIAASYLKLFPEVRKFHAVSQAIADEAVKYNADPADIQTIYSYVDNEVLSKPMTDRSNKKLSIISVGRFFWIKGYEYAIDALGILKQRGIDFKYTLIAQGKVPDDIKFQIHQLGLKENIEIINGLQHNEVMAQLQQHDTLLLTSVQEGIANVVLEAMATGCIPVSTECGGIHEVITNNVNGFIAPMRDTIGIANALEKVSKLSAEERKQFAASARQKITEQHNSQLFRQQFKEFYNS